MKKMNNKGFSLVELIIVIAIMAVLMGVLAPQLLKYVEDSRQQTDLTAVAEVENAVKIACSIEEIYDYIVEEDGATVTVSDGKEYDPASSDLVEAELGTSIPDPIEFSSKMYKNETATITIGFDENGNVSVTTEWSGGDAAEEEAGE